jgi:hypothetical protein
MKVVELMEEKKEVTVDDLKVIIPKLKAALGFSPKKYTRKREQGFKWEKDEVSVDIKVTPTVASHKFMGYLYDDALDDGWIIVGNSSEELLKNLIDVAKEKVPKSKKKYSQEYLDVAKKIAAIK